MGVSKGGRPRGDYVVWRNGGSLRMQKWAGDVRVNVGSIPLRELERILRERRS